MSCHLDLHGIRVVFDSECRQLMDWIRRDYRYFLAGSESRDAPDIQITLKQETPPWEKIPPGQRPAFRVGPHTVYNLDSVRLIRLKDRALTIYDLRRERGTVFSEEVESLYQVLYLLVLSRIGRHLDRKGVHRMHALGVTFEGRGLVFFARSGAGKSTLGLELMKDKRTRWLGDEIPLLDPSGRLLPLVLPPRVCTEGPVPWPPPDSTPFYPVPRTKLPRKIMLDVAALLPRISSGAEPSAIFFCRRRAGREPEIRRIGRLSAFVRMLRNCVVGEEFPQTKAFFFEFSLRYALETTLLLLTRARRFLALAFRAPAFRFDMTDDPARNASLLKDRLHRELETEVGERRSGSRSEIGTSELIDLD